MKCFFLVRTHHLTIGCISITLLGSPAPGLIMQQTPSAWSRPDVNHIISCPFLFNAHASSSTKYYVCYASEKRLISSRSPTLSHSLLLVGLKIALRAASFHSLECRLIQSICSAFLVASRLRFAAFSFPTAILNAEHSMLPDGGDSSTLLLIRSKVCTSSTKAPFFSFE